MELKQGRIVHVIGKNTETFAGKKYWNCNLIEFDGQTHVVSHRAILTLVVTAGCNAGCKFCSNYVTFTPSGPFLRWGPKLERLKTFALVAGVRKIAFTGGEPTLNPQRLYFLMAAMNPGFSRARLHTNGFGLLRNVETPAGEKSLLEAMMSAGLTGVSVSVAHFDTGLNQEIMQTYRPWPGMSNEQLSKVAEYRSAKFTPRLSCVMTAEGVNSVDDIFSYMAWGRSLGYRNFIFRSCSEIPDGFKKPTSFTIYNDENHLAIDSLSEVIGKRPGVELKFRQRKSDSKVDVYAWNDIVFDIDESSEEPDPDPKIRRLIVMPNGVAYTSWIDPLSTLFDDDEETARKSMLREFPDPLSTSLPVRVG